MLQKIKSDMINIAMPRLKEKFPNYSELIDDKVIYTLIQPENCNWRN